MNLVLQLSGHRPEDDAEAADLRRILSFIACHEDPFDRRIPEGHLTASAVVVSAAGDRVLLIHHRKLQRWLQPGGHADAGERSGESVALREVAEETGLRVSLHPSAPRPLDVDVHDIPAYREDPPHEHLDLRYLVMAHPGSATRSDEEASDLRWFTWDELESVDLDAGLRRALGKVRRIVQPGEAALRR